MAQLRSLRLRGFKTFAKPTELTFEKGVTVIIGPNGSGKSNLADAILWVLGEQSPSSLRGRSMQDVIFSGPDGKRLSSAAEVSVVFDNQSGLLPIDAQEVEVVRRLERDGGSEYRLNGSNCRLLDVQDVIGALGLGREMHSVVSQGKVDALLSSTPEARRAMIEEACGLGRLKKRRERARAKLERTRQNLLRVADLEREVQATLRPLRQQAAAAERYAQVKEEWAEAKAKVLLKALWMAQRGNREAETQRGILAARKAELEQRLEELRRERTVAEEALSAELARRDRLVGWAHHVHLQVEQLESRVGVLRQRLGRLEAEKERAARRREVARAEATDLERRLAVSDAADADRARLERVAKWQSALREALEQRLPAYQLASTTEEELRDVVFELEATRSRLVQDRDFLRREWEGRVRLEEELKALVRQAEAKVTDLAREAAGREEAVETASRAVAQTQTELKAAVGKMDQARAEERDRARAVAASAEQISTLEARGRVLGDLLSRREGVPSAARQLLAQHPGSALVIESLSVEPGYEKALVAALGPLAQAVVLPDRGGLAAALEGQGPVEVLLMDPTEPSALHAGETAGSALSPRTELPEGSLDLWAVVSGPPGVLGALRGLLPPIAVLAQREKLTIRDVERSREGWCLVSRGGEIAAQGAHVARRQELASESLLRWRRELEALEADLARLRGERAQAEAEWQRARDTRKAVEAEVRAAEQRLREAERILGVSKNERELCARRMEEAQAQLSEARERLGKEQAFRAKLSEDLEKLEGLWIEQEARLETARADLRSLQAQVEELRVAVGRLEAKRNQANLLEVRLRERCRAQEAERTRLAQQHAAVSTQLREWTRRETLLEAVNPVLGRLLAVAQELHQRARAQAASLDELVREAHEALQERTETTPRWGDLEAQLRRELEEVMSRSAQLEVERARFEDRCLALQDELAELRQRHAAPRLVRPEDVAAEEETSLQAALERAERRLERLGPVNPLAEAECAELEQRAAFLAEQRRDLEASISELEGVIREVDAHVEKTFAEMFAAVKEHFASTVATVFPGARGSLSLVEVKPSESADLGGEEPEEEKELGTLGEAPGPGKRQGIQLEIKFPNKAPRSLSLLSGGEKAMAAIAFLFSLFLARPCPFYILDEVDASLDDINIRRFLSLVRRYKERTQFIIITHQRQTMEVADTLYGVTLERDGTSRVLSRRLTVAKGA